MVVTSQPPAERYALEGTLNNPTDRQLVLLASDGSVFARRGGCVDSAVKIDEVPQHMVDALLAMEDRRFFWHFGVDPIGVLRAAKANSDAGQIVQGGSTLTQQLAKNAYLFNKRTFARKYREAVIALWLEFSLSKREILKRYLSTAYFGGGCYGLRAAARHFFGEAVSELTLPQSAFLVALLRSPTTLAASPDRAKRRAKLVLDAMVTDQRLSRKAAQDVDFDELRLVERAESGSYYADWIAQTVVPPNRDRLTPLRIETAFDGRLQRLAEEAVEEVMARQGPGRNAHEAALVAMRPDGRVVAMVGGLDHGRSKFNRAVNARRQPGSAFKLFVYLAALRAGVGLDLPVLDAPITVGDWSPANYGHRHRGPVRVADAFAHSINTVAVRLSEAVGRPQVIAAARDLGLTTPLEAFPSVALGAFDVTLLELTSAYAAVAARAYPVKPWGVISLGSRGAKAGGPPPGSGRWKLEKEEQMLQLLAATVQRGTGHGARLPIPAYGKTGTSQEFRNAWFVGFAGNLVVGVWVGNDDNSSMRGVTGGSFPALIWRRFVDGARREDPNFSEQLADVALFNPVSRNQQVAQADWSELQDEALARQQAPPGGDRVTQFLQRLFSGAASRRWQRRIERPRAGIRWRSGVRIFLR